MTELVRVQDALSNVAYGEGAEAAMAALESMESRLVDAGILKVRVGVADARVSSVSWFSSAESMETRLVDAGILKANRKPYTKVRD